MLAVVWASAPVAATSGLNVDILLDGRQGNPDEVMVVSDRSAFLFGKINGDVLVSDGLGDAVEGASVNGLVLYYGSSANQFAWEVGHFAGETDANGVFGFTYSHSFMGAVGGASIASLPGYYELVVDVSHGEDTTSIVQRYWVRPAV